MILLACACYAEFTGKLPEGSGPEGTIPVQITSDPDGAVVYIDGIKQDARTNAYYYVTPGDHQVKVSKDGYQSYNEEITFPDESLFVRLKKATSGVLKINVHPEDNYPTVVYLDGIQYGHAPISEYLPFGKHTIKLVKEFYNNLTDTIDLNKEELVLDYTLKANSGMVSVWSIPQADIFIDGEKQDVTLYPGNIVLDIGKHTIRAEKEGYAAQKKVVDISGGDVKDLYFVLNGPGGSSLPFRPGEIWVGITSVPEGATLTINGDKRDEKTPGVFNVKPGDSQVKLSLIGYQTYDEEIAFPDESPLTAPLIKASSDIAVVSTPSPLGSGKLKATVVPEDATILIDGSKSDISRPIQLDVGEYTISASYGGYVPYEGTVTIQNDQTKTLNIVLEPVHEQTVESEEESGIIQYSPPDNSVRIHITSEPSDADVYVNNKIVGKTPYTHDASLRSYKFTLKKSGSNPTTKVVDLSDGIDRYYSVNLNNGEWLEGGML